MQLGRVIAKVVAAQKTPCQRGLTLLAVRLLTHSLKETKKVIVCIDTVSAGINDIVLTCGSSSARMTQTTANACTDNTIIAVVDTITVNRKELAKE